MPEIELDAMQIMAFQRLCQRNDIEVPDEAPDMESWLEEQVAKEGFDSVEAANDEDWQYVSCLEEDFPHDTALERLLYELGQACPVCGDPECGEDVAYVGATPIHASKHPENQPRHPK